MKKKVFNLSGSDWIMKDFVGLDWVWRDSVKRVNRDNKWWRNATVPGSIVNDLFKLDEIPDPYYEMNSLLLEWIPERNWVMKKSFVLDESFENIKAFLIFEGIDYEAQIFLNDKKVGFHSGMFTQCKIDITKNLVRGENLLSLVLSPAPTQQPQVGKTSLTKIFKSRMTYWWDFCPRMIHIGIWDDVRLELTDGNYIEDIFIHSTLDFESNTAKITVDANVKFLPNHEFVVELNDSKYKGEILKEEFSLTFEIKNPKLWYPNGYGDQHEYMFKVYIQDRKKEIKDKKIIYHGVKKIIWNDDYGLTVNNKRIYIRGYNWVPIDVLYGVKRPDKLKRLIDLAVDANINMFRVWGGGLIERDDFYSMCSQKGILIWQEFTLSSSGIDNKLPNQSEVIEYLASESKKIIRRKRNFTALAIWCGGNELQGDFGLPLDDNDPLLSKLKESVSELDPQKRFLATSPLGGVFSFNLKNIANNSEKMIDVHGPWEHQGIKKHYELYNMGKSKLHSEFGVEGMTNADALTKTISTKNIYPTGKENKVYFHKGSWWNNNELVKEMFFPKGMVKNIDKIRRSSQYLQYEGLKYAIERNRCNYPYQCGTLPWQFNEPYPNAWCTSAIDYYANPKPGYYGAKKAFADCMISAKFDSASLFGKKSFEAGLFLFTTSKIHEKSENKNLKVLYSLKDANGTNILNGEIITKSLDEGVVGIGNISGDIKRAKGLLLLLRLYVKNENNQTIGENEYLFTTTQNYSYLHTVKKAKIEVKKIGDNYKIINLSDITAYWINSEYIVGNYFNLLPGESRTCYKKIKKHEYDGFNIIKMGG